MKELNVYNNNPFRAYNKVNFSVINSFKIEKHNAEFMEISGSYISNGEFTDTNFYGISFLSTKFSNIKFIGCNLAGTDLCSIWVKECVFSNTDLSNSTITDSMFIDCVFDMDSFASVTLTNSHFINCTFNGFPIDDSTVTLNYFDNCVIKKTHFTESFYYQLFENCVFEDVEFNVELLGYNFGFSREFIDRFSVESKIESVKENFIKNQLLTNAAILSINVLGNYYDLAMLACITAMCQMMRQDILVKNDEIQFLRKVTEYLDRKKLISEFIKIKIWHCLNLLRIEDQTNVAISRASQYLQEFSNMLYFSFQSFQQRLDEELKCFENIRKNNIVEIQIIYKFAPAIQIVSIMESFRKSYLPDIMETKLVSTKQGSFIEIIEAAEPLLPYLKTFLSILGTASPFIIYGLNKRDKKKEKEDNKNKEIENENTLNTNIAIQNFSQYNIVMVPNVAPVSNETENIIKATTTVINASEIGNNPDFCGYNSNNVQSINIKYKNN